MRLGAYYRYLLCKSMGLLPKPDEWVLDIGCHDGYLLSCLDCCKKVGIDLAPEQPGFHPVWPADGRYLPFANGSFDHVYLLDVIEHVEDYGKILSEAVRVLRAGGTLLISTPSRYWRAVPVFLTSVLDRRWGHVRRGHTAEDIQVYLPPASRVSVIWWNMPYFRSLYFPMRALWRVWPDLGRQLVDWITGWDRRAPPNRYGHLLIHVIKQG